jgi:hypothetical protein
LIARRYNAPVLGYVTPHTPPVAEPCFTRKPGRPSKAQRNAEIVAMRIAGAKLRVIAERFCITPQAVAKICSARVD